MLVNYPVGNERLGRIIHDLKGSPFSAVVSRKLKSLSEISDKVKSISSSIISNHIR